MPLTLWYNLQLHSAVTPSSQSSWKAPAWPLPSHRFGKACFSVCKLKASIWQTRTAQSWPLLDVPLPEKLPLRRFGFFLMLEMLVAFERRNFSEVYFPFPDLCWALRLRGRACWRGHRLGSYDLHALFTSLRGIVAYPLLPFPSMGFLKGAEN